MTVSTSRRARAGRQALRVRRRAREVEVTLEPHRLCNYLYELAGAYTAFYEACPVLKAEGTCGSRLALCELTAETLETGLGLLGITVRRGCELTDASAEPPLLVTVDPLAVDAAGDGERRLAVVVDVLDSIATAGVVGIAAIGSSRSSRGRAP